MCQVITTALRAQNINQDHFKENAGTVTVTAAGRAGDLLGAGPFPTDLCAGRECDDSWRVTSITRGTTMVPITNMDSLKTAWGPPTAPPPPVTGVQGNVLNCHDTAPPVNAECRLTLHMQV